MSPRDNWCPDCDGMYSDDEMENGYCIYCNAGVDGVGGVETDAEDEDES